MDREEELKILEEAKERYEKGVGFWKEVFESYEDDVKFYHGDQWPDGVKKSRELDNRPCLTINRLPAFVNQVASNIRENSPSIQIHPVDDVSDPEIAEVLEGLVRQIEYQSQADQAYDQSGESILKGGLGLIRILTDYSDDSTFYQDIFIKRELDPTKMVWDPAAKEYDKSDARWCFYEDYLTDEEFEETYLGGKEEKNESFGVDWKSDTKDDAWNTEEGIRVAEYWCKKPITKMLALLDDGSTFDITDIEVQEDGVNQFIIVDNQPRVVLRTRQVESHKIVRYLLTGDKVLEGPQDWAGKYFPFVPVYGPEDLVNGKVKYRSLIKDAKDPQRQYNYWQTTITEKVALTPKAPWLLTAKMMRGRERQWQNANIGNYSALVWEPDPTVPGLMPQRQEPASLQVGEVQQAQQAIDDIKSTIGMYDASLGNAGNETSGRAIIRRQQQGDMAAFPWIDNLTRSISQVGRVIIDLIPKIYDTERVVRIRGRDGEQNMVKINHTVYDPTTDTTTTVNDLSLGKYDVAVSTGPSYKTQRLEAADSMIQFMQAVPQAAQVSGDLIAKNMDWPGAEEIAERLKKALPPGLLSPEEQQELGIQPPPPDPMMQLQLQKAQLEVADKQSNMGKDALDAEKKRLDILSQQLDLAEKTGQMQQVVEQTVVDVLQKLALSNQNM